MQPTGEQREQRRQGSGGIPGRRPVYGFTRQLLQADGELYESLFQSGPTRCYGNEMPAGFAVGNCIESCLAIALAG
tara:strand:- start:371 stop:598 length:228 start_codon:yes stop_codon:yes gene_type:complete